MRNTSSPRFTPGPKREKAKRAKHGKAKRKVIQQDGVLPNPLQEPITVTATDSPLLATHAKEAIEIIRGIDDRTNAFIRHWIGYNALYNAFPGSERERLMACIEAGITDEQAAFLLSSLNDELRFYASLPPGNMRLGATHPEFRRRATLDMRFAEDQTLHPTRRLAHLMAAVYQVRCNLFHGQKRPQDSRSQELISKGERIVRETIDVLVRNTGR